jgi:lysophospholipase L1-like esterase
MKYQIVISCFLLIASAVHGKDEPNSAVPDKPEIFFLLGGQSNMAGNGFTKDLPKTPEYEGYRSSPGNVYIWDAKGKKWTPLGIGSQFGPEIGFAHTLSSALPGKHIGIVKYAAGGTSMDQWTPEGKLYSRLLADYQDALKSAPDMKLAAMLWHQGESDSDAEDVAKAYQDKFIHFIKTIRKDTQQADLLFIYGQINPARSFRGVPRFLQADIVRKAQQDLRLPRAIMITTDDCEMNKDGIHYSAKGQVKMGKRFAETYLKQAESGPGE